MKALFTILALIAVPVYANTTDATTTVHAEEQITAQHHENSEKIAEKLQNSTVVIQTGAFNNDDFALGQAARVSLLGVPSQVVKLKNSKNNSTMHVVRSYRMQRPEAEKIISRLREQDVPAMMIVY